MKGQEDAEGGPTYRHTGRASTEHNKWINAVSSVLSELDLTNTFQIACNSAPNNTTIKTDHVMVIVVTMLSAQGTAFSDLNIV